MGVLAWAVGPAIIPHTSLHPGLVHWMLMVVGMMWQFLVSLAVLRHELGGLHWPTLKKRIWLNLPRSPRTGKPRKVLFLWGPAGLRSQWSGRISGHPAGCGVDQVATRLGRALVCESPSAGRSAIPGPVVDSRPSADKHDLQLRPRRGAALPRRAAAADEWSIRPLGWVANTVLFGLYHVHKIWAWPSMIASSFGIAWATRRFRSFWMGVIVHGLEGFFIVLIVAVLAGWYPKRNSAGRPRRAEG